MTDTAPPFDQKAYNAAYYLAHRAELAGRRAAYRASHRNETKTYNAAYRAANRDRLLRAEYHVAYRATHRQEMRARASAWHAAHPDANRRQYAKRQGARTCDHPGCLVIGASALAWQTNPHACWICGTPVWQGVNLHMDHVVPIAKGGLHCADNLRPACGPCNMRKGARVIHHGIA